MTTGGPDRRLSQGVRGIDQPSDTRPDETEGSLADALGIEVHYAPEDLAPPVDSGRLRDLIAERLPRPQRDEVLLLVATFRSWQEGLAEVLREGIGPAQRPE